MAPGGVTISLEVNERTLSCRVNSYLILVILLGIVMLPVLALLVLL